jgi:hypothetical protein
MTDKAERGAPLPSRRARILRATTAEDGREAWHMHIHDDRAQVSSLVEVDSWRDVKEVARYWGVPMTAVRCRERTRRLLQSRSSSEAATAC